MEKTSKITRTVFQSKYASKHGVLYNHEIEFENGDKGQISCKENMPAKINPGQILTYTIEQNGKYFKIKAVNAQRENNNNGGGNKYQPADPSIQMIGFAMSYTKDFIIADKLNVNQLETGFERVYNLMKSKLDQIKL